MAMFQEAPQRPEQYRRFERETPGWFRDAKLGVFVHWGPYSVPAWAEPTGTSGTIDPDRFFLHNPYAEWYFNTIRIAGSPAAEHHREVYGDAPYDDFLDQWTAEDFDAADLMELVAATGAGYFVPTTKHHDGVTLWDAPGTGDRNTVHRGPRRDLVDELGVAARAAGVRFGVYYSGGLDWHVGSTPPIVDVQSFGVRPVDRAYADYAHDHVADLIARYRPDVLWGDIEWPDAGKAEGPKSLVSLFESFYAANPEGVVNDRWGETHWDFRTSEYQHGGAVEGGEMWENTRGIGYSFGYNQLDDESTSLSGPEAISHFVDVVSRGGNLLLNIGLTAEGTVPDLQRRTLVELAEWNSANGPSVFGSTPVAAELAKPGETPWVRWTRTGDQLHAFVRTTETAPALTVDTARVDPRSARFADGAPASVTITGEGVVVGMPAAGASVPVQVTFDLRSA